MEILKTKLRSQVYDICRCFAQDQDEKIAMKILNSMDGIVAQAIALWIVQWSHSEQFSQPTTLNAFFSEMYATEHSVEQNSYDTYASDLKHFQRTSKKLHEYNNQYRKNQLKQGVSAPQPFALQSKHQGIPISKPNIRIIQNYVSDSAVSTFQKKIDGGQMANSDSVSNAQFVALFADYEDWYNNLTHYNSDEEYLINSIDFFSLQVKKKIDLIAEIAVYMDQNGYKDYPYNRALWFWHTLNLATGVLEANQVLTYSQAIPIVFSLDQESFESEAELWFWKREIQACLLTYLMNCEYNAMTTEKAAAFFKESYNVLSHHTISNFGTEKAPNARRIHLARTVMKSLYNRNNFQKQGAVAE